MKEGKISGNRHLNEDEISLINAVKLQGEDIEMMIMRCAAGDRERPDLSPGAIDEAKRWRAIATTHYQQAQMALVRSIGKPMSF